jgi:hypothetical protein
MTYLSSFQTLVGFQASDTIRIYYYENEILN